MIVQVKCEGTVIKERRSPTMTDEIFNMLWADIFIYGDKEYARIKENALVDDTTTIEVEIKE